MSIRFNDLHGTRKRKWNVDFGGADVIVPFGEDAMAFNRVSHGTVGHVTFWGLRPAERKKVVELMKRLIKERNP